MYKKDFIKRITSLKPRFSVPKIELTIDYLDKAVLQGKKLPAASTIGNKIGISSSSVQVVIDEYTKVELSTDKQDIKREDIESERIESIKRIEGMTSEALDYTQEKISSGDFTAKDLEVLEKLASGLHKRDQDEVITEVLDIQRVDLRIIGMNDCEKELQLLKKKRIKKD